MELNVNKEFTCEWQNVQLRVEQMFPNCYIKL